ncbi:MAG: alpha/beta fold hydrolase [Deltaproteobacteria bacterium]|nr:alpha/beta fold hydrolase [Candidatus Zymogenaceae bacterium]
MPDLRKISSITTRILDFLITGVLKLTGVIITVNGIERIPPKSVIFVCNHYTRIETILLPYIIEKRLGVTPRSLTARYVFESLPRRFMEAVGSVPVNIPDRDTVAVKSLLSGESWIIFPEGEMVKDRKVLSARRFLLHDPDTDIHRPPHTGAAVIALKAQLAAGIVSDFAERYRLTKIFDLESLSPFEVRIVPVNITYWPQRFVRNGFIQTVERAVQILTKGVLPKRFREELMVESSFLKSGVEITINFGIPKATVSYAAWLSEKDYSPVFRGQQTGAFSRAVKAMMTDYMKEIYELVTVNPDHLVSRLLFSMTARRRYREPWEDIKERVFAAALTIREIPHIACHNTIADNPHAMVVWGESLLDDFLSMGIREGLLERNGEDLVIKEKEFKWPHGFHDIRLLNTIEVINNEIEPLTEATKAVDAALKIGPRALHEQTTRALIEGDRERYLADYSQFYDQDESREMQFGMPGFNFADSKLGVLLVHGYLASPEQMRPLLEHLTHRGITVYNARLSGHGTSALDLVSRTRHDWYYSVRYGYTILSRMVQRIFVCGFGMGGLLGWLLAAQNPPRLSGVISISAAMRPTGRYGATAPLVDAADHLFRKMRIKDRPIEFTNKESENPHFTYPRNPAHGMYQIHVLIREVTAKLPAVTVPALIIQGGDNPAVDTEGAYEYRDAISSEVREVVLVESPYHGIVYRGGDELFDRIAAFIRSPGSNMAG